jgi:quercetin dioxygenase-like cupin family protein
MDRATFESELRRDGYEIVTREMPPNNVNPEHAHEFDARVLITAGQMTIETLGSATTFRPGEICAIPRGQLHAEAAGPEGAAYVAGRRLPG